MNEIKPYFRNAKKHPDKQLRAIAKSLKEFGCRQPIVVDRNNEIIVGHGRWMAYQKYKDEYKLKEPKIEKADDLTPQQVKAYRLADNKLNESDWDMDLAIEELKELDDNLVELTGFDKDLLIEPEDKDDEVPEIPDEPKAKMGDIYQLGNHRVICGDSMNREDVEKLMNGKRADMVFTDPPYALFGNSTGVAGITDDKMTRPFFLEMFRMIQRNTKLFAHIYTCCDWHSAFSLQAMAKEAGLTEKNLCIWDKGDGGVGGMYQQCYEMIWFMANSPLAKKTMGKMKSGERTINGKPNIWRFKRSNKDRIHNAQKPIDLIVNGISNSSDENDIVLDLFLGSGSTLIACEKTNRICYGMELDCRYISVIIERWCRYTGNDVIRLNDNKKWSDIC